MDRLEQMARIGVLVAYTGLALAGTVWVIGETDERFDRRQVWRRWRLTAAPADEEVTSVPD